MTNFVIIDAFEVKGLRKILRVLWKQRSCLEEEIVQRAVPGARMQGRPHKVWNSIIVKIRLTVRRSSILVTTPIAISLLSD